MNTANLLDGLIGAWGIFTGSILAWVWHRGQGFLLLDAKIRRLLAEPRNAARIKEIIILVSGFANLTPAERQKEAARRIALWLEGLGVHLTTSEVNLILEIAYQLVKREHPLALGPPPVSWGKV